LGFSGRDRTGVDRSPSQPDFFARLSGWLDYAVALGVNGVALGPIFESETHGYDTVDHFAIDTRLGTRDGFDSLVDQARSRGVGVLLDGVFNHAGRSFVHGDASWRTGGTFEGHDRLPTWDHSRAEVVDYTVSVMKHWLAAGAAGWRLDAAYAVDPGFWAAVLPAVRADHPDAWFVGEVIHGDYGDYVARSGLDSVTQYELWKAIWSSLVDGNLFELAWALRRHNEWLTRFVPMTFVGNHDVTRLASRLPDRRLIGVALTVLMTIGGTPSVYYGDERAYEGVKEARAGGDDVIRPEFPAAPGGLSALGADVYRLHQDLIGLRRRHAWLHRSTTEIVDLANRRLVYECRDGAGRVGLRVDIDLDRDPPWSITDVEEATG
jgi:glycosidase